MLAPVIQVTPSLSEIDTGQYSLPLFIKISSTCRFLPSSNSITCSMTISGLTRFLLIENIPLASASSNSPIMSQFLRRMLLYSPIFFDSISAILSSSASILSLSSSMLWVILNTSSLGLSLKVMLM